MLHSHWHGPLCVSLFVTRDFDQEAIIINRWLSINTRAHSSFTQPITAVGLLRRAVCLRPAIPRVGYTRCAVVCSRRKDKKLTIHTFCVVPKTDFNQRRWSTGWPAGLRYTRTTGGLCLYTAINKTRCNSFLCFHARVQCPSVGDRKSN